VATSDYSYSITLDTSIATRALEELTTTRLPAALDAWLIDSAELAHRTMVDYAPQGVTGDLQKSFEIKYNMPAHTATVGSASPYALAVEKGTRPHMPPIDAITPWAEMHGLSPWAVAMGIKKHGTPAQPFFKAAVEEVTPIILASGARTIAKAIKE
jgi:hypothetical protein